MVFKDSCLKVACFVGILFYHVFTTLIVVRQLLVTSLGNRNIIVRLDVHSLLHWDPWDKCFCVALYGSNHDLLDAQDLSVALLAG